ncbi:MAG: hypothetical protein PHR35_14080 [Kiritimatiellae bacterium]|nr:hypothetical protein [Kiritimatiellia bacterium]
MAKAKLVRPGEALCGTCVSHIPVEPCTGCGRNTRRRDNNGQPLCKKCQNKDRTCLRCGKPLPRASLLVEGGAVCYPCSLYYKEPETCQQCGQMDLALVAVELAEGRRKVCHSCWARHQGFATCSVCRKHRRPAGATMDGKPICKRCLEAGGKPFICPKCGKEGIRHSASRCMDCYQRDVVEKRFNEAAVLLQNTWAKDAFLSFRPALLEEILPLKALVRVDKYFLLFARLDASFSRPSEITPEALLKAAGGLDGLRRFAVPYGHLVKTGVIPEITRALLADTQETLRQDGMLEATDSHWYGPVLRRFRDHLETVRARYDRRGWKGEKSRMKARTITSNLRAARQFCEDLDGAGVAMLSQLDAKHMDRFLMAHSGSANSIRAFVRYLNRKEKLFRALKIKTVSQDLAMDDFLSREKQGDLLRAWLNPDDAGLREALMGLFLLLYAQTVKRAISLKLSDISMSRGTYRVLFGRTEIALDARVGAVLARHLETRKALATLDDADDNGYLFPGRRHGEHLTAAAVTVWLHRNKVQAEQLFATALFNAYRSGLRHPKVLVKAFGITSVTAIKYLNLIDPRMTDEMHMRAAS